VGTYLYTSPEITTGIYSEKSDVFSLGIILVELFSDFQTGMERHITLSALGKEGVLPAAWSEAHAVQARIAQAMVANDPDARPSCAEVLSVLRREGVWGGGALEPEESVLNGGGDLQLPLGPVVSELRAEVARLRAELAEKNDALSRKDEELARLRQG
jgi:serine/threonine protein kinase